MKTYYRVLSIAGSDPSGGAGIQADIKSISACGCFATTAITAIVNENTVGVYGVHPIPLDFVQGQIKSVLDDIGTDAIKIGMLHSSELIRAVKASLLQYEVPNIVLDPVMVATSGDALLLPEAIATLKNELIPMSRLITPNIPEAEILSGEKIHNLKDMHRVAQKLGEKCRVSVLLKGGHQQTAQINDVFFNREEQEVIQLESNYINTKNKHGTGCSLSSALASFLARGKDLNSAVRSAKHYIDRSIESGAAYQIGKGNGPVNHFWETRP
ncbi:MAG: bifunctional hydroxymethylpyrimidine kinase/phosphomethylpyrimidine kinase [Mangrovibacterium sp.]